MTPNPENKDVLLVGRDCTEQEIEGLKNSSRVQHKEVARLRETASKILSGEMPPQAFDNCDDRTYRAIDNWLYNNWKGQFRVLKRGGTVLVSKKLAKVINEK